MPRPPSRPKTRPKPVNPLVRHLWLAPGLIVAVLSLPGLQFPYLFDDFDFLGRVQTLTLSSFLPDPEVIFWRPLSREVYFGLLYSLRDAGPILGHVLNIACLVAAIFMIVRIGTSLGGRTSGLMTGLVFASFSQLPFLAAWLSGSQDLLAILFILFAIDLRERRRYWPAAGALVLGLLSKEIAVAFVPLLILFDWILGRRPTRLGLGACLYGGIAVAWAAIHPGIHALFRGGFRNSPGGYVGLEIADRVTPLVRSAITLANLPVSGLATPVSGLQWQFLCVAVAILAALWYRLRTSPPLGSVDPEAHPRAEILRIGAIAFLLPAIMTHAIVRNWAVYYTCVSFVGIALIAGGLLSRLSLNRAVAVVALVMTLGFWSRNMILDPGIPSERNLKPAATALRSIEDGLKTLNRQLPARTDVLVSIQSAGAASVYLHIYRFQAPRIWYHDPTLVTHRPDYPISGDRPKRLFWIDPEFKVFEIDLVSLASRPPGGAAEAAEYKKVVRYYARGLAAGGDVLQSAILVLKLREPDPVLRNIDLRAAVMAFRSQGKFREAKLILDRVPQLPIELRVVGMGAVLAAAPNDSRLEDAAFMAFEIPTTDVRILEQLGQRFESERRYDLAASFGRRLLTLDPTNEAASKWVREAAAIPRQDNFSNPISEGIETPYAR